MPGYQACLCWVLCWWVVCSNWQDSLVRGRSYNGASWLPASRLYTRRQASGARRARQSTAMIVHACHSFLRISNQVTQCKWCPGAWTQLDDAWQKLQRVNINTRNKYVAIANQLEQFLALQQTFATSTPSHVNFLLPFGHREWNKHVRFTYETSMQQQSEISTNGSWSLLFALHNTDAFLQSQLSSNTSNWTISSVICSHLDTSLYSCKFFCSFNKVFITL